MTANSSVPRSFAWYVVLSVACAVLIVGCGETYDSGRRSSTDPAVNGQPDPKRAGSDPGSLSASAQEGQKLFRSLGCMGCHTVNGQGGSVGPDLSNEGNRDRSRQWLTTQIRDPRKHNPQSIMPAFNNLSSQQVNDLVEYLESLKTTDAQAGSSRSATTQGAQAVSSASAVSVTAGGKLWGQTCGECHNLRLPSEYSDAQWAVAVHHMRVRVPLTGEQQQEILAFLQASN